jgi:gluconate 2-dehydrogenase gamma chain
LRVQIDAPSPIQGAKELDLEPERSGKLDRRALLMGAVFLVGGAAALLRFSRSAGSRNGGGPVLSSAQYAQLEQIADVMIPATDTPGALAVGVPGFLRQLLTDWASDRTRADVIGVLDSIERQAWSKFGAAFVELPAARRAEVVSLVDAESIAARDAAYSRFKYLVLVGYYQSEIGATQELRYELVPGAWRSCLPLTEVGRASAV